MATGKATNKGFPPPPGELVRQFDIYQHMTGHSH